MSIKPDSKKAISLERSRFFATLFFTLLLGVGLTFLFFVSTNPFWDLFFKRKPLGNLPTQRAVKMLQAYQQRTVSTSTNGADNNVRSIYFDFKSLRNYMARMIINQHASGVRIYLANYDSTESRTYHNPDGTDTNFDLKGYNTVILVPTTDSSGFNIEDIIARKNHDNKLQLIDFLEQPVLQAQNTGVSCPPYPPSACKGQNLLNYSKGDLSFLK